MWYMYTVQLKELIKVAYFILYFGAVLLTVLSVLLRGRFSNLLAEVYIWNKEKNMNISRG